MDFQTIWESLPALLEGTLVTLLLSIISIVLGTIIGALLALSRVGKGTMILSHFASYYSNFFRGTPALIQLFIIYFGLPALVSADLRPFPACIIALSLNSAAYISEVIRAGILSVPIGQTEAARMIGMTNFQILRYIIMPQAIKTILPAIGNEFIDVVKGTSTVSVIGMQELTRDGQLIISRTYATFEIYGVVALIYFILIYYLSVGVNRLEVKLNNG